MDTLIVETARFVGESKSMEMIFTGRMVDAADTERANLVSLVMPAGREARNKHIPHCLLPHCI